MNEMGDGSATNESKRSSKLADGPIPFTSLYCVAWLDQIFFNHQVKPTEAQLETVAKKWDTMYRKTMHKCVHEARGEVSSAWAWIWESEGVKALGLMIVHVLVRLLL